MEDVLPLLELWLARAQEPAKLEVRKERERLLARVAALRLMVHEQSMMDSCFPDNYLPFLVFFAEELKTVPQNAQQSLDGSNRR